MREPATRLATATTLPLVLDSTEPAVIQAGLEALGGRAVVNSVNYEDGDGPDSRFAKIARARAGARCGSRRAHHRRGRPGAHGRVEGPRRRPDHPRPARQLGLRGRGHHRRLL
ncbi:dihydropteroate synthase [Yinghuangia aomiensis]